MSIPYFASSRRHIRKRKSTLAYPILAIILAIFTLTARSGSLRFFGGVTGGEADLSLSEQFKVAERDHVRNVSGQQKLVPRVGPESIGTYEERILKGRGLMCLMSESTIDPATQSTFTTADLGRWGWEPVEDEGDSTKEEYEPKLDDFFNDNGITRSANKFYTFAHWEDFFVDGLESEQSATMANYGSFINEANGLLIAITSSSPEFSDGGRDIYPKLGRWSDVNWLMWKSVVSSSNIAKINKFIRLNIQNADSKFQIARAFADSGFTSVPIYPGHTFEIDPITLEAPTGGKADPFFAMLGSKNPSGCAYFLAQHKGDLGIKTINSITVWQYGTKDWDLAGDALGTDFTPYMVLNVIDKPVS